MSSDDVFNFTAQTLTAVHHNIFTTCHEILFEDFAILKDGLYVGAGSRENWDRIGDLFPGCLFVSWFAPFVIIVVESLPPKPWPLTVGGAPLYITTDPDSSGPYMGRVGQGEEVLIEDQAKGGTISYTLMRKAADYLVATLGLGVTTVDWYGCFWVITVADGTPLKSLPCRLMDLMCRYKFASQVNTPEEAAFRHHRPRGMTWDMSDYYPNLRPGIMLSSSDRSVTAGMAVQNAAGEKFMTAPSHAFTVPEEEVFHPDNNGRRVGVCDRYLDDSDIALIKLDPSVTFAETTFEDEAQRGTAMPITGYADLDRVTIGDQLVMSNPFSGFCTAMHLGIRFQLRIPTDEPVPKLDWHRFGLSYLGNGLTEPLDGSCGTIVQHQKTGDAVSIFRFVERRTGIGFATATTALKKFGYEPTTIP